MKRTILKVSAAAVLFATSGQNSHADGVPRYDPAAYCLKAEESVGGSLRTRKACRETEEDALAQLTDEWTAFPSTTKAHCHKVAEAVGGSYPVLMTCIEREMDAASIASKLRY
ncbi:MAG: hypothetical protein EON58_11010 [Alphaproteobacteria bacterium]|nr:MAG: hypothetical protein EON58_11010 [Alphaproteobacteria bacterium]